MKKEVINNIIRKKTGVGDAVDMLTEVQNANFQSLLLEVLDKKSLVQGIKDIKLESINNPYVRYCEVDQSKFLKFDMLAYHLLPEGYSGIELSPLMPFAINKQLANISQKRIFSTTRNAEIISDPTMALAICGANERLEKLREDGKNSDLIKMATSQRSIRQEKPKKEGYTTHFRTFTLSTAGRDVGFETFEKENLEEHLVFFLSVLKALNDSGKYTIDNITITLANGDQSKLTLFPIIKESTLKSVSELFPDITFKFDADKKSNYYSSLRYSISAKPKNQETSINIAGGGITNWTQKLIGSKKERLLVGSLGSEVLIKFFTL